MTVVGIIPARHASTRFPGKPLALLCGKPMLQWVHERVGLARTVDSVLVATDDPRIQACVEGFGGRAVMTSQGHPTGTDRVAEVARTLSADVIVNIQGDEPLIEPGAVDEVVEALLADAGASMSTLATPLRDASAFQDPNVVKVVRDLAGRALYFSRAPIPHERKDAGLAVPAPPPEVLRHVGLYAYRRAFLLELASLPPTPLERTEKLEQLRALEHGARIAVAVTRHESLGVDTPSDVAPVEARLRALNPSTGSTD